MLGRKVRRHRRIEFVGGHVRQALARPGGGAQPFVVGRPILCLGEPGDNRLEDRHQFSLLGQLGRDRACDHGLADPGAGPGDEQAAAKTP
jgi:hypothetical protein